MHQSHFLLESRARTLSLIEVMAWDDEKVFAVFCELRWPKTNGEPVCPECESDARYAVQTRRQWRCKCCGHTFSVTSGTWLHGCKLELKKILVGIVLMANAAKSLSALELSRNLNVQYKTAYVFFQKMRDALLQTRSDHTAMRGQVEIDVAHMNPHDRPANKKSDRPGKNKKSPAPKQCVLVIRERDPNGRGARRTVTKVLPAEDGDFIRDCVESNVVANTEVFTDQHEAYGDLEISFRRRVVNHDMYYVGPNGESTNQAESYFSRFRRMVWGQVHRINDKYLDLYANEVAFRDDSRRWPNGKIAFHILSGMLRRPEEKSRFRGYWSYKTRNGGFAGSSLAA